MPPEEKHLTLGVLREVFPGENRVALVPAVLASLKKAGCDVLIEAGAGSRAGFSDEFYAEQGATIVSTAAALSADILVQVRICGANLDAGSDELHALRPDQVIVGLADPLSCPKAVELAASRKVTAFALEFLPRISRAQSMDVLSSQASIAGYKAVLIAAERLGQMFPMMITAAGTMPPAQVFVVGAGVAGLQAIATAKRLGAVVSAYDVRPAAQADIESLGARAISLPLDSGNAEDKGGYAKELGEAFNLRQQEFMAGVVKGMDVVITTALIPGRKAPVLITGEAVEKMRFGSVIVDCAAEKGGNCALTRADEAVVTENGVALFGPTNLPSTVAHEASAMFAKNMAAFLTHLVKGGKIDLDRDDQIIKETMVTRNGEITSSRIRALLEGAAV